MTVAASALVVPVDEAAAAATLVAQKMFSAIDRYGTGATLVDDGDADRLAVADAVEMHGLAIEDDLAVVRPERVSPRQHLHEGRLACAVRHRMAWISPRRTRNDTSSSACTQKSLVMPRISSSTSSSMDPIRRPLDRYGAGWATMVWPPRPVNLPDRPRLLRP